MATVVRPLRPVGYPWDEWCDGQTYEVNRGVDFERTASSFRKYLHVVAQRRGLVVQTEIDGDTVVFQFEPTNEERK